MNQIRYFSLFLLLALFIACGGGAKDNAAPAGSAGTAAKKKMKIAVIPKGTTHEFWKSVHAGAKRAAAELNVEIVWKGPLKEDDLKQQIDLVQSFIAQGVSGIVLAPLNDKALLKSVKDAGRRKIPTVVIDSALSDSEHKSFVATDNQKAGGMAGVHMAKLLDNKGKLVVLRYQEGSASTHKREEGFVAAAKKAGLEVVSDNQYGGATTESAFAAAETLLLAQRAADGDVDGVFCPNESTTFGMMLALEKLALSGKVKFIGFDASKKLIQGVRKKTIDALVLQDPFTMGYLGVKSMVDHLSGKKLEAVIDTGSVLVIEKNLKEPKIQALLNPS